MSLSKTTQEYREYNDKMAKRLADVDAPPFYRNNAVEKATEAATSALSASTQRLARYRKRERYGG